jgi:hypothetical protein
MAIVRHRADRLLAQRGDETVRVDVRNLAARDTGGFEEFPGRAESDAQQRDVFGK